MIVSLIAAVASNGAIGCAGGLPWRLPDDMRFFQRTTVGHYVITGRKNYEAMGRPLPRRSNVIVTRNPRYVAPCPVVSRIEAALALAQASGESEAFVIGGADIYRLALPYAHLYYRTRVLAEVEGDVFFPDFDESPWAVETLAEHAADSAHQYAFVIEKLSRRGAPRPFAPAPSGPDPLAELPSA